MFGIEEIDAAGLAALMERDEAPLLVDVRSPAEMAQGMLPGAQVVPYAPGAAQAGRVAAAMKKSSFTAVPAPVRGRFAGI